MMKFGIIVIIFSATIGRIASQCGVENCDNFDLLTHNTLGLMELDEVEPLCSIIHQLEMCVNPKIQDCSDEDKIQVKQTLRSAKVICQNTDEYRKAVQCYFEQDVEEVVDICTEDLKMNCPSISTYETCITRNKSLTNHCSQTDITLLGDIVAAYLHTFLQKYNCIVTTRETTLLSTRKTSSTSSLSSTTSSSTAASRTTRGTNNPSGPGPNSGKVDGGAASLETSLVLSLMALFSAVTASLYIDI